MSKRVLITGIDGFTGRHLAPLLSAAGYEVHGLVHRQPAVPVAGAALLHPCDLTDATELARITHQISPERVVHLAAIAFVVHEDAEAMYRINLVGTRNLLEGLIRAPVPAECVLLASSANVYGNATEGMLDEGMPANPANDYAVSKLAMEYLARLYRDRLPIVVVRPFNYTGVGQDESFLVAKIVAHVRRAAPVIELGNLHVARDFSDVRTVVSAYARLLEAPSAVGQTFNVCSGKARTLDDVIALIRGLSATAFEVRVNPAFVRANEVKLLVGDRSKLETCIGSLDLIDFERTLRWMLDAPR